MKALIFIIALLPAIAGAQAHRRALNCQRFTTHLCDKFDPEFLAAQQLFGLPAQLFKAVAWTESRCKTGAKSHVGAMGVMQIMPRTWETLRQYTDATDPWDPLDSIVTGGLYLTQLVRRYGGPTSTSAWVHAIVAYNGGPGAVPSAPKPNADDWLKFSDSSTHYADQVISAYLCQGAQAPAGL